MNWKQTKYIPVLPNKSKIIFKIFISHWQSAFWLSFCGYQHLFSLLCYLFNLLWGTNSAITREPTALTFTGMSRQNSVNRINFSYRLSGCITFIGNLTLSWRNKIWPSVAWRSLLARVFVEVVNFAQTCPKNVLF